MVSIIIPTFNYGSYLTETLNSVKEQSFQDWECIIIDDGSTDNTREIVDKFTQSDNRFKYIHQTNSGVSSARNAGIKASKGNFIQFLDGDDLLQTEKINSQLDVFNQHPHVDIVYNEVLFFDDGYLNRLRTSLTGNKPDDWMPKLSGKGNNIVFHFSKINFMVMNAPLLKKSVIEKTGYFNDKMDGMEDWDFWMRCALSGCYFHFNEKKNSFALVRVHTGSLSTQAVSMKKGHYIFLENILSSKNCSRNNKILFSIKYSELYWNSVFSRSYSPSMSPALSLILILSLPLYGLIKLMRLVK